MELIFETDDFASEKDYKKFVTSVKYIIRKSPEYNIWTDYIKHTLGHKYCQFTKEVDDEVTVDLHHHPYALQDIVETVISNNLVKGTINSLNISKEVLLLHYNNEIGFILLVRTLHEKFHNGFLDIPMNLVLGNYSEFERKYSISQEIQNKVSRYKQIVLPVNIQWKKDNYILDNS